jgi:predicted secreted hydrolase
MRRRALLASLLALGEGVRAQALGVTRRPLVFPRDFGAHPDTRTEWWYATGWLQTGDAGNDPPTHGFQVTFFRSRTDVDAAHQSAFAARQLVFAHAAVTDVAAKKLRHDQRIARAGFGIAEAQAADTAVTLRDWQLHRSGPVDASRYRAQVESDASAFALDLELAATQPVLLQGEAGYSRKGPHAGQASHYYSQPQLAVSGTLRLEGRALPVRGKAWLDHEWSETVLDAEAVGWDWIGMNFFDGSALTAFRIRRADGRTLWAGGSFRRAGEAQAQAFASDALQFTPGRRWTSPSTRASYPVEWTLQTPAGRFRVQPLVDAQELDSRASTGTVYWEGLSELQDANGRAVGRGYLEMTGYASRMKL